MLREKLEGFRPEEGLIPYSIFVDDEIYQAELKSVFRRSWLFLGFESWVKERGDYFTTTMGETPVVVTKDEKGNVRVFLNYCTHKGMRLCRATSGNSSFFRCPYHGWTFSTTGELVGVPYYEPSYIDVLDKSKWGLREVENVKIYKGTIWASLSGSSFYEFLGDMRLYLDMILDMLDEGRNLEVFGGIHRWLIPVNWKLCIENFAGDAYHAPSAHASVVPVGLRKPYGTNFRAIYPGNGHGILSHPGGLARAAVDVESISPFRDRLADAANMLAQKYGEFVKNMFPFGPFNVFPNFSFHFTWNYIMFRVWQPRGPSYTEMQGGVLVFGDLPAETKREVFRRAMHEFGPTGLLEQDDAEIWSRLNNNYLDFKRSGIVMKRTINVHYTWRETLPK